MFENHWIFSKKIDLIVFMCPFILLLYVIIVLPQLSQHNSVQISIIYQVFFTILIDTPHVYSTFLRPIIIDPDEAKQRKSIYVYMLIAIFFFVSSFYYINEQFLISFVLYLNIFHFVRQQIGWISWTNGKAKVSKLENIIDKALVYVATLAPILWFHSVKLKNDVFFIVPHDMTKIFPDWVGGLSIVLALCSLILFCLIQLLKKGPINIAKVVIFISTWFSWSFCVMFLDGKVLMLDILHSIPYIYLIFFYGNKLLQNKTKTTKLQRNLFLRKKSLLFYLLLLSTIGLITYPINFTDNKAITYILVSFSIYHYLLDGLIWSHSKKQNREKLEQVNL